MIPTSDVLRDQEIAKELANQERESQSTVETLWSSVMGFVYGNETVMNAERDRIMAELRGEPASFTQAATTASGDGPNWAEIDRVLNQYPEVRASMELILAKDQPEGPTFQETLEQTYGGVGNVLASAVGTTRGLLTLVVIGILGLAVFAIAK